MRYSIGALLAATALYAASAHAVMAADLPVKAPAYVPDYNWTGPYLGGQVGGGWATTQSTVIGGGPSFPPGFVSNPINSSGALGGAYAGYNYQINQVVLGIDGDYSRANLNGSSVSVGPTGSVATEPDRTKWIATATGRLGYVINDLMFFGKGGWAWAEIDGGGPTSNSSGVLTSLNSLSSTRNGWTLGAGAEWRFALNWTAKLEYDYMNFGAANETLISTAVPSGAVTNLPRNITASMNIAKIGVAYQFR